MRTIEVGAEFAEDVLLEIATHLPRGVELGRPVVAVGHPDTSILTSTAALWSLDEAGAARMVQLGNGRWELTRWRDGEELSRMIGE